MMGMIMLEDEYLIDCYRKDCCSVIMLVVVLLVI